MQIVIFFVGVFFQVYTLMLFARILGSWFPQLSQYQVMRFIAFYVDPYLNFFRRFVPPLGMFDFSPIIAFICLGFLEKMILSFLFWVFV
jgi:YggT family protein